MSRLIFTGQERLSAMVAQTRAATVRTPVIGQQVERVMKAKKCNEDKAFDVLFGPDADQWIQPGPDIPAGLWFVKDHGIYLMSNARSEGEGTVIYATGYDPDHGDVYDKCRDAVGGDDFAEFIDVASWDIPVHHVQVTVTGPEMIVEVFSPRRAA